MARTKITPVALEVNGSAVEGTYTDGDATNGMYIDTVDGEVERCFLHVKNGGETSINATIKAGYYPRQALGDLTVAVAGGKTAFIGPFETARFEQEDGTIYVDLSAATSVTLMAYQVPKNI
jgi:hypothetical protein